MKRYGIALIVALALVAQPALAAITLIGVGAADADNNAAVTPTLHGSSASGHLGTCFVTYRGGDSMPTASGWTIIKTFGGNQENGVLARILTGSGDAPTITPTTGGTSIIAKCATWAGDFTSLTGILVDEEDASNASQQNIDLDNLTVSQNNLLALSIGRKGDDWTSVAQLTGMTEIVDEFTTLGTDAGLVVDYVIQTTATALTSTEFVVTGGAASTGSATSITLRETPSCSGAPVITSVGGDNSVGSAEANVALVMTNGCVAGSITVRQNGNSHTLGQDSYSATAAQVDMSGVGAGLVGGFLFGPADIRVTTSGGSDDQAVTITPPSGTIYGDITTLAPLGFDEFGSPSRPYGYPNDLQDASQIALRNAVGCTLDMLFGAADNGGANNGTDSDENDIWPRTYGALTVADGCTGADFDFSRDGLYLGTFETLTFNGAPPQFSIVPIGDRSYRLGNAIAQFDFSAQFSPGDALAFDFFDFNQLTSSTNRTNAASDITEGRLLPVDSLTGLVKGDYISCDGGPASQINYVDPFNLELGLIEAITCIDNATVAERGIGAAAISGLNFSDISGVLSGEPLSVGTAAGVFVRATNLDGLSADTNVFDVTINPAASSHGGSSGFLSLLHQPRGIRVVGPSDAPGSGDGGGGGPAECGDASSTTTFADSTSCFADET